MLKNKWFLGNISDNIFLRKLKFIFWSKNLEFQIALFEKKKLSSVGVEGPPFPPL